ncbi:HNH endonuclease [Celeribacter litoreus]|uniref:HNH endonuclease n=1 Tax=Celeribacter litoreus TaxID=2876714 RepID=UPI001CCC5685|nr:HNH endonuclease signature motif containing protein [Celeribacter litoreus]MCA0044667.1 HNH endonuclease [Celeribacter litoreus]
MAKKQLILTKFDEGREYSRLHDIHTVFGGQRQGGISTPRQQPYVFIFTGKSGEQHGYSDGWRDEGVFLYTGEGQSGDMEFKGGNKAIRDHSLNGKDLLLFEALGKSKPVRYLGRFACESWDTFQGPDTSGNMRECIQFHLVKTTLPSAGASLDMEDANSTSSISDLYGLRQRAFAAARPRQAQAWGKAPANYRARSKAVRDYVLARANGICELTGRPAPFLTKSGQPYLEVHHTRRLSDDGPDDPRYVAAICPTAHREIHFGANGEELNQQLIAKLKVIESS